MMNPTQQAIYDRIASEKDGVWLVDWKYVSYDELQAIRQLRVQGVIEAAAYGGLKIKKPVVLQPAAAPNLAHADDVSAIHHISVVDTASMKRVMVVMNTGEAYRFEFTVDSWQYAKGLLALAAAMGPGRDVRLSNVRVYGKGA